MHGLDLSPEIRTKMLAELADDVALAALAISSRLTPAGAAKFPGLLRDALAHGDEATLVAALAPFIKARELSHRRGRPYEKAVPSNAAEIIAHSAIDHYHARAVCLVAIERGCVSVEVYRAREVAIPRPRSAELENTAMDVRVLLTDLRNSARAATATELGVPGGPNSGINVRLV